MKKFCFLPVLLLFAMALMLSCGDDDDCPTCPASPLKAVASGFAVTDDSDNSMYCYALIYGVDGKMPTVDSVTVGGNAAEIRNIIGELGMATVYAVYEEEPTTYDSGDTLDMKFFLPTGTGTARVQLLDDDFDEPTVLSHSTTYPYDTVAIDQAVTITWRAIARADYYAVRWTYRYDSSGTDCERADEDFVSGANSLVIPANTLSFNGRIGFSVMAISGPQADTEPGNISGAVINGNISSISSDWVDIYVGTGSYSPVVPPDPETPQEIIESFVESFVH